jgi:hypothetical protein
MDKRKGNVPLCWVPGLAEKTGNKEADEEAKRALDESIPNDENYLPENLSGWRAAEKQGGKRGESNERENTAWQIDTKKLKTRDQMAVTKLRTGYSNTVTKWKELQTARFAAQNSH